MRGLAHLFASESLSNSVRRGVGARGSGPSGFRTGSSFAIVRGWGRGSAPRSTDVPVAMHTIDWEKVFFLSDRAQNVE